MTRPSLPTTSLCGAVLCGGASSRMGRDKALLPHPTGLTFLQYALSQLAPLCNPLLIAGRASLTSMHQHPSAQTAAANSPPPPFHIHDRQVHPLPDPLPHQGPLPGVIQSLRFASQHWLAAVLVIPVDMPKLTSDALSLLIDRFTAQRSGNQTNKPVVATFGEDRAEPLIAIYPTHYLANLEKCYQTTRGSLFRWLQGTPHQLVNLAADLAANINTPQDLYDGPNHPS